MSDFLTISLLLLLVGLSFYGGHLFTIKSVTENILTCLKEEGIIRFVEDEDGETKIYSGYKFYEGDVK
tara:strand:- start:269 stop:472 length:204 start_codon:yes stop_codon:yes gene_type:complete